MASPQQQQNINQLKFLQSQLAGQQAGLPGFATPQGQVMSPAQAAAAGAPPAQAAQFANIPAQPQPAQLNRAQKQQQIGANVAAALKAPAPGKGKAVAALVGGVAATPQAQQQLTTSQQVRIIAREAQKYFRGAARNGNDFLSGLSTPGDIWFPVLVLLVLLFVIVPVAGADGKLHTRLSWLWLALIGQAHVVGEVLTSPIPAALSYNNPYSVPGGQVPGTPGLTNQQKCAASGGTWQGVNATEGKCTYATPPGPTSHGSGSVPQTVIAQPLYTGNATLTFEDYL